MKKFLTQIRHLKAGLRLVIALCQHSDHVTKQCVTSLPLLHCFLSLYNKEHMAQSIKLLILK